MDYNQCLYPNQTGLLNAEAFRQMWSEAKAVLDENNNKNSANEMGQVSAFDAGTIFAKFDSDHDGQLNKQDFEAMLRTNPELFRQLLPEVACTHDWVGGFFHMKSCQDAS